MDNQYNSRLAGVLAAVLALFLSCNAHADPVSSAMNSANNALNQALPTDTPVLETETTADPLQWFNRPMFVFNDNLDTYLLKPVATIYNKIMPKPLNQGIHNVFYNIDTLPTIANDILQLHWYQALNDIWRVMINTTLGIGGLFDIAERMNLKPYQTDFGITMARWGWTNSTYLVLPFFGANTIRDGIEIPVDYFAFSIYPYIQPESLRYQIYFWGVVDRRAQLLKFQSVLDEAALDKYVFMRNAYLQRRAYQIQQNKELRFFSPTEEQMRVKTCAADIPVIGTETGDKGLIASK